MWFPLTSIYLAYAECQIQWPLRPLNVWYLKLAPPQFSNQFRTGTGLTQGFTAISKHSNLLPHWESTLRKFRPRSRLLSHLSQTTLLIRPWAGIWPNACQPHLFSLSLLTIWQTHILLPQTLDDLLSEPASGLLSSLNWLIVMDLGSQRPLPWDEPIVPTCLTSWGFPGIFSHSVDF